MNVCKDKGKDNDSLQNIDDDLCQIYVSDSIGFLLIRSEFNLIR